MRSVRPAAASFRKSHWAVPHALLACSLIAACARHPRLEPFRSDGCSLFPDQDYQSRTSWCGCCVRHDWAYWQGGSAAERKAADSALAACVRARTGDETLARAVYAGTRAGGPEIFPAWYRWGYGWPYGARGITDSLRKAEVARHGRPDLPGITRRLCPEEAPGNGYIGAMEKPSAPRLAYPPTRKSDQVDILHGVRIEDPYRWLEDLDSPETKAWVEAQDKVTFAFLEAIPSRQPIKERLTRLWNYERFGAPFRKGKGKSSRYFFFKNDGLQNQSVLYTMPSLDAEPKVLLDPNTLSPDGTVSLSSLEVSEDGELMAYGLSASGSDWESWRVRRVSTGEDLPDRLERIKFSGAAWKKDGSGFFYGRYDQEVGEAGKLEDLNKFQKLYFHRLGDPQEKDVLVHERADQPDWGFSPAVTDDGKYLVITVWMGTDPKNLVLYKDLTDPGAGVKDLIGEFKAKFGFAGSEGTRFWFLTDLDAPRGRVLAIDLKRPAPSEWKEVIPEAAETLENVSLVGNRFVAAYLKDAHTKVKAFSTAGAPMGEIALPGLGTASGFSGEREDMETFFGFTGFTFPTAIYRHDFRTGKSEPFRKPALDFDPSRYETRQVFAASKDGTKVPVFLVHRKGLVPDGSNPTYLYGYGGFGVSLTPSFSTGNVVWLERGGVLAVAVLRGGGEYGEEWHQAGTRERKQNVFDDFIAAAEWLIREKYTSPAKLAIGGGSNGGLLVAACMIQRPDLFAAVLPAVGVHDMLRFHKFTIGWAWTSDYGSPDKEEDFRVLRAYSPLHNLKPGTRYPAVLITTADHDDRVVPSHSFKFAAALQAAQAGPAPVLIRIETKAGHGAGKPMAKVIEETADRWAFLAHILGLE
jgi:prolyl oligopeptidase